MGTNRFNVHYYERYVKLAYSLDGTFERTALTFLEHAFDLPSTRR